MTDGFVEFGYWQIFQTVQTFQNQQMLQISTQYFTSELSTTPAGEYVYIFSSGFRTHRMVLLRRRNVKGMGKKSCWQWTTVLVVNLQKSKSVFGGYWVVGLPVGLQLSCVSLFVCTCISGHQIAHTAYF